MSADMIANLYLVSAVIAFFVLWRVLDVWNLIRDCDTAVGAGLIAILSVPVVACMAFMWLPLAALAAALLPVAWIVGKVMELI